MRFGRIAVIASVCGALLAAAGQPVGAASGMDREKAAAVSEAGVVLQSDIPIAFTAGRSTDRAASRDDAAFHKCLGVSPPTYLALNRGTSWVYWENLGSSQERSVGIFSTAAVTKSPAAAMTHQRAMGTSAGADCYRETLRTMIARDLHSTPELVNVDLMPAKVKGADEAWAWQFSFNRIFRGEEHSGKGYVVGSRVGRTVLTLTVLGNRELGDLPAMLDLAAQPVDRARAAQCRPLADAGTGNPMGVLDC